MTLIPVTVLIPESYLRSLFTPFSTGKSNALKFKVVDSDGSTGDQAPKRTTKTKKATSSSSGKVTFYRSLFGGKTPSQLFEVASSATAGSRRKGKPRRHLLVSEPCYRPGYLTASQLLALPPFSSSSYKKSSNGHACKEKQDQLSPSELALAYKREHGYFARPQLFHGLTASQLLLHSERKALKVSNYKKYMSHRLYPSPSQLFLLSNDGVPSSSLKKQQPSSPNKKSDSKAATVKESKKSKMLEKMSSNPSKKEQYQPRSLLEPTPSLLLLKHLSLIPTIESQKKGIILQQKQPHQKQSSRKEIEDEERGLEPLLFGF